MTPALVNWLARLEGAIFKEKKPKTEIYRERKLSKHITCYALHNKPQHTFDYLANQSIEFNRNQQKKDWLLNS